MSTDGPGSLSPLPRKTNRYSVEVALLDEVLIENHRVYGRLGGATGEWQLMRSGITYDVATWRKLLAKAGIPTQARKTIGVWNARTAGLGYTIVVSKPKGDIKLLLHAEATDGTSTDIELEHVHLEDRGAVIRGRVRRPPDFRGGIFVLQSYDGAPEGQLLGQKPER